METTSKPSRLSALRLAVGLYIAGAIVSFGPITVTLRDLTPPGPMHGERQGYAVMLGAFIAAVWPLYWSYEIASQQRG